MGVATYTQTKYARLTSISKSAARLNRDFRMDDTPEGYVEAAMAFLERNKDIYPDRYKNAVEAYDDVMKKPHVGEDVSRPRIQIERPCEGRRRPEFEITSISVKSPGRM